MKIMSGIDLHSNNAMVGLMDMNGKRLLHKKVDCELEKVLRVFKPYKDRIDTIAVESTFNWYWLVDGLQDEGYNVVLANPARIDQYNGLKHTDDKSDAYFLAELLRLGILPAGHIYERRTRPIRDILRRRLGMVRKQTSSILSLKSLYTRNTGGSLTPSQVKAVEVEEAEEWFTHPADKLIAGEIIKQIRQLKGSIQVIEAAVKHVADLLPSYQRLQSFPGIGNILGYTITLETGEVSRFASSGDYASYCRTVNSRRISNGKQKGRNNGKCGNVFLAWAWVEAANFACRYNEVCRKWVDRKASKTNGILARKALACKLSKAGWHCMTDDVDFNLERVFPGMKA